MILLILLLSILPITPNSFAQVVFTPQEQKQYFPGDFISGTLTFNQKVEKEVIQLKGKNFLNNFYVSDLEEISKGQVNITLVPLAFIDTQKSLVWSGESVNISALSLGKTTIDPKSFYIFEHSLNFSFFEKYWPWLVALLFLGLLGALLWKIRKNKMSLKFLMLGKEKRIALWRDKITQATNRYHFEMIYNKRKEWMPLINAKTKDFFEVLNKHQYKKEWNETEYNEVKESYLRFKDGI